MYARLLLLFFLVILFFSTVSKAQNLTVVAGGNYMFLADEQPVFDGINFDYNGKTGFHAGAFIDYTLKKHRQKEFVIEPGVLFELKGAGQKVSYMNMSAESNVTMYYVDVPVYFEYRYRLRSRNKVFAGIGPYVGYAITGNESTTVNTGAENKSAVMDLDFNLQDILDAIDLDKYMNRLDYGITMRIGMQAYGGFTMAASFDYGIPKVFDISDEGLFASDGIALSSRMFRLSLGYTFDLGR